MTTTLDALRVELTISREALLQQVALVPDSLFDARPSEDTWSTSEILDHLLLVERRVNALLAKFIEGKPDDASLAEPAMADVIRSFEAIAAPRSAGPLQSPSIPTRDQPRAELLSALQDSRTDFFRTIDSSHGIDLRSGVFPHPFFGELDLYQWLLFVARHEDRHRRQIARLCNTLEPSSNA